MKSRIVLGGVALLVTYWLGSSMLAGADSDRNARYSQQAAEQLERQKTPAQRAADANAQAVRLSAQAKTDREDMFAIGMTRAIRDMLKNPASFQVVSALLLGDGVLCLTYRATNSFNAVTTEVAAVRRDGSTGDWSRDCAGKSVERDVGPLLLRAGL